MNLDAGFVATVDVRDGASMPSRRRSPSSAAAVVDAHHDRSHQHQEGIDGTIPTSRAYGCRVLAPGARLSDCPTGGSQTGVSGNSELRLERLRSDADALCEYRRTGGYFDFGAIEEMIVRPGGTISYSHLGMASRSSVAGIRSTGTARRMVGDTPAEQQYR
jgi:hypothetical protein